MRFLRCFAVRGFFAGALCALSLGCIPTSTTPAATPTKAPPVVSRDISKLARIVTLPRRPLQAVWQYETLGSPGMGPTDYRLSSIMLFRPDDAKYLQALSVRRAQIQSREIAVEPWFPAAIKKMAVRGVGGRSMLKVEELDANDFFKMSLMNGSLYHVEHTPYLILSLFTT